MLRLESEYTWLFREIVRTTALATNMTEIRTRKMFKMNFRVFGVVSLFTCWV